MTPIGIKERMFCRLVACGAGYICMTNTAHTFCGLVFGSIFFLIAVAF